MDLPAFIMVNPVLAELLEFCLCVWNDVLKEFEKVELRGALHCRAAAEKEKAELFRETDEYEMISSRDSSSWTFSHMKSFAMHRQIDARQMIIYLIGQFPIFMNPYSVRKCNNYSVSKRHC